MIELFMKLSVKIPGFVSENIFARIDFKAQFLQILDACRNFTF